jgi:Amt family ammonium transporter
LGPASGTGPTAAGNFSSTREVRIGVLANHGAGQCLNAWGATAEYLTQHLPGFHFAIVPLGYADVEPAVAQRQVDFVFVNPGQYVALEAQYRIGRVATIKRKAGGGVTAVYGTVIFRRADRRDIRSLNHLRGKSFMAPEENSFGGWLMAMRELRQAGIDPSSDLGSIHFTGSQDAVVLAVLRGEVDAGAVRTDTLESMAAQGKVRLSDFQIIDAYDGPLAPEFPYLVSTRLYPEWPLAKVSQTPLALAEQVAQQLRNMPEAATAAQKAGIAGWTYPADYDSVRKCLEELRIGPFCPSVTVTLAATVRTYWPWLLAAALAVAAMTGAIAGFARMNHRLVVAQKQLQRLSRGAEQSPASIVITDRQGTVEYVNPGFLSRTGYTLEEALGKNPRILKSGIHSREFYEQMWRALNHGEVWRGEICNRKKNGDLYWEDATIAPILDAHGTITDFVAVKVDISERKQAEEALKAAKEQAEEASRAKSRFLASMSHELRTPLNGVIGMAELLANTALDDRQRRFVEACQSSGKSLLALINDILDFSKIEAGKLELDEHDFDLDQLVEETVETLAFQARQKGVQLFSHIAPPACLRVYGDSGRLRQLLVNLIGNAIKFTEIGEVAVRVAPVEEPTGHGSIRFAVTDTGIGIPPDRLDRLFVSFTQADSSTTRKYGGTGLGLAISKSLVSLMGGQIGVESRLGRGSTFWFTLPLKGVAGRAGRSRTISDDLQRLRVLVLDGRAATREHLVEILRSWRIPADTATTPAEALAKLGQAAVARGPVNLVLVDGEAMAPEQLGDFVREVRQTAGLSDCRIFILASPENTLREEQRGRLGIDLCLSKPPCQSALLGAINDHFVGTRTGRDQGGAGTDRQLAASPALSGARVLLAEDNRVNRMFAGEILRQAGIECHAVENGREALEVVQGERIDLILMDCQMPEMDGFEATRRIREMERNGQLAEHLPVIALTANAIKGDRERCVEAGMDDYISKPFEPHALLKIMSRFLASKEGAPAESAVEEPRLAPSPDGPPPIDGDALLVRCLGNLELAADLLSDFAGDLAQRVEKIARHARQGDARATAESAHALKGSAGTMGAEAVRTLAARIEAAGGDGDVAQAASLADELRGEVQRCLRYLPGLREKITHRKRDGDERIGG